MGALFAGLHIVRIKRVFPRVLTLFFFSLFFFWPHYLGGEIYILSYGNRYPHIYIHTYICEIYISTIGVERNYKEWRRWEEGVRALGRIYRGTRMYLAGRDMDRAKSYM